MAELAPYNAWLHARFEPYLGRRILEVGSGVGNQTRFFADRERVVASDVEAHYLRELGEKFRGRRNLRVASYTFPLAPGPRAELLAEALDTIVCLNVLEHIEDDGATLRDFASILPPGGASPSSCRRCPPFSARWTFTCATTAATAATS